MIFQCSKCHKFFSKKYNYDLHLRRKIPCKNEKPEFIGGTDNLKLELNTMLPNVAKCCQMLPNVAKC